MIDVHDLTRRDGDTIAVDHVRFAVHPGSVTLASLRASTFGVLGVGLIAAIGAALGTLLRRSAPAHILLPSSSSAASETLTPSVALAVLAVETAALVALALSSTLRRNP